MNGKQAIDALLAPHTDFDLILTDIMMPEVDGMELMRIVQESDKPFKSIPVVVMSTVDDDAFQNKCQAAGAQDYLVKPLRKAQVAQLGRHASLTSGSSAMTSTPPRQPNPWRTTAARSYEIFSGREFFDAMDRARSIP